MKNKIAGILLALAAFAAPLAARADLIWYEGFNYPDGSIEVNSGGLWIRESGTDALPGDLLVTNHVLQVSATGTGSISSRQDDVERLFIGSSTNNPPQPIFASFTIICSNLPSGAGSYFGAFYNTNGGYSGRIQALTNGTVVPGTWRLGITANGASTASGNGILAIDLATNIPYQVVAEIDPVTLLAASVWVNPISSSDPAAISSDSIGFEKTNSVNAFAWRQASGFNGLMLITNLDAATTFAEAATNIWATNAVAPEIAYPPVGLTNFVGVPVSLSVVADGQGQANLTYTWVKTGNPGFSNPNGNSPVLSFSSPLASDSGSYSVIVTTPYGLSTTSSPVTVSISAQPVPPKITSGPNSANVFVGQSVTFSVQVTSPGNLSFQWKSNNVDIPGENNPSLILTDVQTNFSANYSVGVTNDVVPNGVVSSNAVLVVSAAPNVSVAFLRTLVDPGTFVPTNIPATLPYSVTGVITTFTNVTSGNTASYYLQDATAGINIFATFGSTFRPNQGDVVTFTGVMSSFGGLELDADTNDLTQTSYEIISNNAPLPAPIIIPFNLTNNLTASNLNYHIAGSLVELTNVFFGTNAGGVISTSANETITVTNASGATASIEFFDLDLDTAGQTLPAFAYSVTGVLQGGAGSAFSVAVTKFSDINTNPPAVPIPITAQLSGGNLLLNWSDSSFTLQSSTNVNGPYTNVIGAASPYPAPTTGTAGFFRLIH